jgi:hypothetical protein
MKHLIRIFFKYHHINTMLCQLPYNQQLPLPLVRDVGTTSSPPPSLSPMLSTNPRVSMTCRHWPTQQPVVKKASKEGNNGGVGARRTIRTREESRMVEVVWNPHTTLLFLSFLQHQWWDGMKSTCHLISTHCLGIKDEVAWNPHAASFSFFLWHWRWGGVEPTCHFVSTPPRASTMRRCETHTSPCFSSFLLHWKWGGVKLTCRLISTCLVSSP